MKNVIIYIGAFELPDRNAAAQRVRANATLLRSLGYEVVLVGRNADQGFASGALKEAQHDGIDCECWEFGYPGSRKQWLQYISKGVDLKPLLKEKFCDRLHSVICYNFPALAQLRIRNLARKSGAKGLADVTEWYQKVHPTSITAFIKNLDTDFRMKFANFRMDGLITTSRFLTDYYSLKFDDLVELPTLIEMNRNVEPFASPDGAPKRIFFAGAIEDPRTVAKVVGGQKDRLDWVMELLDGASDQGATFHFDIFGVEESAYLRVFKEHEALVRRLNEKVIFHGRRPREELLDALTKSDFSMFMRPSILTTNAGFPTKFSESVTFGTPVITSKLDCLAPFMQDGQNCIEIDRERMDASITKLTQALAMQAHQILQMSQHCLESAQFHPLSFKRQAAALFSELGVAVDET